jgi:hypothetical protein
MRNEHARCLDLPAPGRRNAASHPHTPSTLTEDEDDPNIDDEALAQLDEDFESGFADLGVGDDDLE